MNQLPNPLIIAGTTIKKIGKKKKEKEKLLTRHKVEDL
jgi:hypothetical protein